MGLRDLVVNNRSYRRFYEDVVIGCEELKELVELPLDVSLKMVKCETYLLTGF